MEERKKYMNNTSALVRRITNVQCLSIEHIIM